MQTFESSYGRKGLRVDDTVPTYELRAKLSRIHVLTPMAEIEEAVKLAIAQQKRKGATGWTPDLVRQTLRAARWFHEENRAEYDAVMSGAMGASL